MTLASTNELLAYVAGLVEELERYAVTVVSPPDSDEIVLGRDRNRSLTIDLEGRFPASAGSVGATIELFERWQPSGRDQFSGVEYRYELRHHALGYRRAFHRHDQSHFLRAYGVATHEHCEATMGVEVCGHYFGHPVVDAFDAFRRLFEVWLTDETPDCRALTCLS